MPPFVIAAKDLRQRFRDRSAIVLGFVAPVAIAALMSVAFRGTERSISRWASSTATTVARRQRLFMSCSGARTCGLVTVRTFPTRPAARRGDGRATRAASWCRPGSPRRATADGHPAARTVLTSTDSTLGAKVTVASRRRSSAQVNADRFRSRPRWPPARRPRAGAARGRCGELRFPETVVNRRSAPSRSSRSATTRRRWRSSSSSSPSASRRGASSPSASDGMIDRMRAAPVRPASILLGKALSVLVYGVTSLATVAGGDVASSAPTGGTRSPPP